MNKSIYKIIMYFAINIKLKIDMNYNGFYSDFICLIEKNVKIKILIKQRAVFYSKFLK